MRIKVDKYPHNADWPKRSREERARTFLAKHMGPGDHPSGSSQKVHGSDRVHVPRGFGVRDGEKVSKYLVDANGNELPNSFEALTEVYVSIDGQVESSPRNDVQELILDAVRKAGLDPNDIDKNLKIIMDSAMARYAHPEDIYEKIGGRKTVVAGPSLVDADRFYEAWHAALQDLSERTDIDFSQIITSAAVISPSLQASANLHFAQDLATWVSDDVSWSGEERDRILTALKKARDGILFPVYMDKHKAVTSGEKKVGDPRPSPKEGSYRWSQGIELAETIDSIEGKKTFSVSDLSPLSAAYALHAHRQAVGGLDLPDDVAPVFRGKKPKGGFSAKNYAFYGDAVAVLQGKATPSDILGDVKTRSFHNNILDPTDAFGYRDVTVDYHAADSAFMSRGFITSNLISSPAVEGVGVGVRPLVADGIRRIADTYTVNGEKLSTGRAQEILWAEWNRGQTEIRELPEGTPIPAWAEGSSVRTVTHYKTFDGTLIPLYNVSEDKEEEEDDD